MRFTPVFHWTICLVQSGIQGYAHDGRSAGLDGWRAPASADGPAYFQRVRLRPAVLQDEGHVADGDLYMRDADRVFRDGDEQLRALRGIADSEVRLGRIARRRD